MKKIIAICCLLLSFVTVMAQDTLYAPQLESIFRKAGYTGCFLMFDKNENKFTTYNNERCKEQFLPASTFKIFNSMAALDAGVVADENTVVKWDSVVRWNKPWNKDHTMREGFKNSTVWLYQYYARTIGAERMQQFIDAEQFGNRNIGGGLERFWLDGELRITAYQQIDFLRRLEQGKLHFSARAQNICKDIMINEKNDEYILRAKTGWADANNTNVGWWVGYVERKGNVYFFAINIGYPGEAPDSFLGARKEIAFACLKELGALPR